MPQEIDLSVETICPACGFAIPAGKSNCPNCGRARAPQWPTNRAALYAVEPGPPTSSMSDTGSPSGQMISAHVSSSSLQRPVHINRGILWLEFLLGSFGVHGVGFFLVRKPGAAVGWLLFSLVWDAARLAILAATAGIGIVCIVPLGFCVSVFVTLSLRRSIRHIERKANEELHVAVSPA